MNKLKSIPHVIIGIFYSILTVLIVGTAILYYVISTDTHDKNICTIKSPDELYTVNFQQASNSMWPSGATTVNVTVKGVKNTENENFQKSFTAKIANNGVSVDSNNFNLKWNKDYVEIDLSGSKQSVDSHIIKFDKNK